MESPLFLTVCLFFPGLLFGLSFLLELIRLNELGLLLPSQTHIHTPLPLHPFLAPHPPPAPSRCVNQYSLLTRDSPHMCPTAQGLHLGAEIVRM